MRLLNDQLDDSKHVPIFWYNMWVTADKPNSGMLFQIRKNVLAQCAPRRDADPDAHPERDGGSQDLIKSVAEGYEAARGAEQAAPHGGSPPMMANLASWIAAEFRRPRPNPWPRTTEEIDEEIIHVMTPGVAFANAEDADNSEVIRIDGD